MTQLWPVPFYSRLCSSTSGRGPGIDRDDGDDRGPRSGDQPARRYRCAEMRVLIDAVHPADVWTLGAVEDRLLAAEAETLWVSRPGKDSVVELIDARGRPHVRGPRCGTSMPTLARELIVRDWRVWRTVRSFRPDVILTRSPAGVHAGRATRTPVLYDTDDGHVAGFLYEVSR